MMTDERFDASWVDSLVGCHLWTKGRRKGYGRFVADGKIQQAHRWSYQRIHGTIAPGLVLDHLCRVRHCVNPEHLEPVTDAENIRRGMVGATNRRKTHCKRGHEFSEENTYKTKRGGRNCKACVRTDALAYYHRKRGK